MPTIPEAKNFAVFSLFFWRSTFAKAALVLAAFAAVSVAFAIVRGKIEQKTEGKREQIQDIDEMESLKRQENI